MRPSNLLRRLLLGLALVVGVLLLLLGVAVLLVDSSAVARWAQQRVVPQVEQRVGRDVSLGGVDVDVFPRPGVVLEDVRVAGGGPHPLAAVDRAVIHLALWPLITSRGEDVRITSVELVRAEVTLLRGTDGTWDFQEPLANLRGSTQQEPSQRTWVIDELRLRDGTVRLVDSASPDGGAWVELENLDATASHLGPGQPLELRADAVLQAERPNVHLRLSMDPAGATTGRLDVEDVPVTMLRPWLPRGVAAVITGGGLDLALTLGGGPEGRSVQGGVQIPDLRLRGQPANARATLSASFPRQGWTARLEDVSVKGPGVDLGGSASATPAAVRFDVRGPLLDLDTLLGLLPEEPPPRSPEPLLSPEARRRVASMDVSGALGVDRVTTRGVEAQDLSARTTLQGGTLRVDSGTAGFYGGTLDLSGTTVDLTGEQPGWDLRAVLAGVDLGLAMRQTTGTAPLGGELGATLQLRGSGLDWTAVAPALTGLARIALQDGTWTTVDLSEQITSGLRQGLERLGAGGLLEQLPPGEGTRLQRLAGSFRVVDGWMSLTAPLTLATPFGTGSLSGRVGLDHRLDLRGTITLDAAAVSQLTGRALQRGVEVPLVLAGTLEAPRVSGIDATALARELLPRREVERRIDEGRRALRDEASRRMKRLLQGG